jgi:hypothetical protein
MTALTSEAPSTLADLVSPLTEAEFLGLLRRRELAYRPSANGDRYAPVLGWPALRQLIEAGNYPDKRPDDFRVTKESVIVPPDRWMTKDKVDAEKLDRLLANGFSIVVLHLDEHVPALTAVCEEIRSRTLEGCFVGAVVTCGTGAGAFKVHYDPEDLVILQVEGTKRWQIFGPPRVKSPPAHAETAAAENRADLRRGARAGGSVVRAQRQLAPLRERIEHVRSSRHIFPATDQLACR